MSDRPAPFTIKSDGTRGGTVIEDANGERLPGVTLVRWELDARTGRAECLIQMIGVPAEFRDVQATTEEVPR